MPKAKLFDEESEDEVSFKTENEYAKKYDTWREKEEMHKLEQKYGSKALESDVSASSDSDEPIEESEEMDAQFLKTLALLKTKDPRIYDPNYNFFENAPEKEQEKPTTSKTLTFDDSDEDDNDGEIFTVEKKASEMFDSEKKENTSEKKTAKAPKLKEFLTGEAEHINDTVEQDLAPLKALWSNPNIGEGEAFLRDYILDKKYLEDGAVDDGKLRDDEDLEADKQTVEQQGKFERAYNFRFEEPDEEFLKRFPRTMNYIRPKDDRRSRKRAEVRTRKEEEKQRKMEEIARLKALKLKEIQEKISKIKEVTGNQELAFEEADIEGDFDPEKHDRRMRALFDEEYYGEADEQKPVFPDLDEELEIENWEKYEKELDASKEQGEDGPHCEDEDFNMDADYDPKAARANLLEELKSNMGKKRRNRKKKSKLAQLLTEEKPKFIPTVADKTYAEYMEEYYKMDCEDVLGGDLPTRFKYREVVPNDYGLTVEEILLADDKELTQWVPLKKIIKHRPTNVEQGDVKMYAKRAEDIRLKKKVLPSLFKDLPEEPEVVVPIEEATKKKKKKKNKKKNHEDTTAVDESIENIEQDSTHKNEHEGSELNGDTDVNNLETKSKKKKKKDRKIEPSSSNNIDENSGNSEKSTEKKKYKSDAKENLVVDHEDKNKAEACSSKDSIEVNKIEKTTKKKKHKKVENTSQNNTKSEGDSVIFGFKVETTEKLEPSQNSNISKNVKKNKNNEFRNSLKRKVDGSEDNRIPHKKKKFTKNNQKKDKLKNKQKNNKEVSNNPLSTLSDERLKAYGLKPKKYRSFLKYKKF